MKNEREYQLLEGTWHGVMKIKSGLVSWQRWVWVPALPSLTAGCGSNDLNYLHVNCHVCKMGTVMLISQSHDGVVSVKAQHTADIE